MASATSGSVAFRASQSAAYSLIVASPRSLSCSIWAICSMRATCRPPSNGVASQTRTTSSA